MYWRILPHASACVAAERLFLLDVRQDRYFQVPATAADAMHGWLTRGFTCTPPESVLQTLVRAGIHRPRDPDPTNALKERVAVPQSLDQPSVQHPSTAGGIRVTYCVISTWLKLRTLRLGQMLVSRSVRSPLPIRGDRARVRGEADAFDLARSLVPIARNCLLDSLALDAWLARRGLGSQLVFGISPTPFAAHCWLQTSEILLNDSFDHVSGFVPILAL